MRGCCFKKGNKLSRKASRKKHKFRGLGGLGLGGTGMVVARFHWYFGYNSFGISVAFISE